MAKASGFPSWLLVRQFQKNVAGATEQVLEAAPYKAAAV